MNLVLLPGRRYISLFPRRVSAFCAGTQRLHVWNAQSPVTADGPALTCGYADCQIAMSEADVVLATHD